MRSKPLGEVVYLPTTGDSAVSSPASEAPPIVRLQNISKTYGEGKERVEAIRDVSLSVPKGAIFGVIGLSGAGKSTLIRCINMLERPQTGTVEVAGRDMTRLSGRDLMTARRRIGMIFQHFNLLASRTVSGNIAFPLEIAGVPKQDIRVRVQELLELVGLQDRANAYPSQLSGGQKQRVGIARALANEPDVLLSDEATSALDPETTIQVLRLIRDINRRTGVTVVMITHEMAVIREICDQVAVMDGGQLVEVGRTVDVFTRPQSPAAKRLLRGEGDAEIPSFTPPTNSSDEHRLIKLFFTGNAAERPIMAELTRNYPVLPNILYGRINRVQDQPWGTLIVDLSGAPRAIDAAMTYLNNNGVQIEIIEQFPPTGAPSAKGKGGESIG